MNQELAFTGRTIIPSEHPAAVYLARLGSGHSRRAMLTGLNIVASLLSDGVLDALHINWGRVRYQHAAAIRARLAEECSPSTANLRLAALRGVLKEAYRLGQMSAEDYHRAVDIDPIRGERLPAGRWIPPEELKALFQTCLDDDHVSGIRDAAIIATMYSTAIRREELCNLHLEDYDNVEGSLMIIGKRNKERIVYIQGQAKKMLDVWIGIRGHSSNGRIFCRTNGAKIRRKRLTPKPKDLRRMLGNSLTPNAIYNILKMRVAQAGIKDVTPHDFRRTCISDMMDKGVDIATVQRIAGHVNVNTTIRYDRRGDRAMKKAAALMELPV